MATTKKSETNACILCDAQKCEGCIFTAERHFAPNEQTKRMLKDGYITNDDVISILKGTLEERCGL